jgi:mannitol-specific phosphotransferase system IIBC component
MPDTQPVAIKRIVFVYSVDHFPGGLIVAHHYLQGKLVRAGYDIAVMLAPLHDMPTEADIVLSPPDLADAAQGIAPHAVHVTLDSFARHPFFDLLIERLVDGVWTAARMQERPAGQGELRTYRGYERVE